MECARVFFSRLHAVLNEASTSLTLMHPQPVSGSEGFVVIRNSSVAPLDIGEWILEDGAGKRFVIPSRTKIGVGAESAFPNAVTGLLSAASSTPFAVLAYPNGVRAAALQNNREGVTADDTASPIVLQDEKKHSASVPILSFVMPSPTVSASATESSPLPPVEKSETGAVESASAFAALPLTSFPSLFLAAATFISVGGALGFLLIRSRT